MGAKTKKVNRVNNGWRCNEELDLELRGIEGSDDGPHSGLGLKDPFLRACRKTCLAYARDIANPDAIYDAARSLGGLVEAAREAGGKFTNRQVEEERSRFASDVANLAVLDDGQDVYDIADAAFDDGTENPRKDLAEIAADQEDAERSRKEARSSRARGRDEGDDTYVAGQVECLEEALAQTKSGDAGALYEVMAAALSLEKNAPAEFERIRAKIKEHSPDLLKRWEKALRQLERERRKREREEEEETRLLQSASAAKGGRTVEAIRDDEESGEPLPDESAHEYGTSSYFDARNPYMCADQRRLMNRDYSVVSVGGDVRILEVTADDRVILHRPDALRKKFENVRIPVPDRKSPVNAFDAWMQWPGRRTHDGIGCYPGSSKHPPIVPPGHFNMWRGFAIDPSSGGWPLLHKHLLEVICASDKSLLRWLLDWIAQMLQEPQHKPGTTVVLRSRTEGTGKSLVGKVLRKILGHAALSASRSDQVAGRFNSHLQSVLLLIAEEALYAGLKSANGILKDLATCDEMAYEAKGLPVVNAPNYTRVLFISNEDWIVPAGPTSRRFAVFDCENPRANDQSYFGPIFTEIDNGGAEAFLHDMLEREITSDLRSPPITKGLLEQRELSLDGFGRWILSVAQSGQVEAPDRDYIAEIARDASTEVASDDLRSAAKPFLNPYELQSIDYKLGRLLQEVGARKCRLKGRGRPRGYQFPELSELRGAVAKRLGVEVEPFEDERTDDTRPTKSGSKIVPFDPQRAANRLKQELRRSAR